MKKYTQKGFTIFETLIALSLSAIFMQITVSNGSAAYYRALAGNDRALLLSGIREARAEALTGQGSHGVFITKRTLTIFSGANYESRNLSVDVVFPFSASEILATSSNTEVVFSPTGTSTGAHIICTDSTNRTEDIEVTAQGAITDSLL